MAYTEEQKAMVLSTYASCRNDAEATAKFCREHYGLSVSGQQIRRWAKGEYVTEAVNKSVEEKKAQLAEIFEEEIRKAFNEASNGKRDEASYKDLMTGIGILTDKMLLMRGEATTITQTNVSREDAALRVMEIIAQAQARRDGQE